MSANRDNGLPTKEATLFKQVVKHYETKQYKKGIKVADQVLKKCPEHGETLAMKGLILNCIDRKTEAYDLVRKGVKHDIKSHVCWHVYGLLYRSDRDYMQAIKCYRGALRHDSDNVQILRDLSLLQVQMRDLEGFVQTRRHLLQLKATNRNNWFTFAVATHLTGRVDGALGIVEAYEGTLDPKSSPENDYEHSEMLLYKNLLLEESGKLEEALAHLEAQEALIVDRLVFLEKRAQLLRQLGRHADSEPLYRQLLRRNPEHYGYHAGMQACVLGAPRAVEHWLPEEVDASTEGRLKELYAELQHQHPKSTVCRRLPLDFARDATHFRVACKTYMLPPLRKGVPSLFSDLKPLYAVAEKAAVLGSILEEWLAALEADGTLPGEREPEMPTMIMWVRVLLAQHRDMMGDTEGALAQIDLAIEHSPTLLDLYMLKARIYKHAGALLDASETMDHARQLDLADRYLNTKATRYMLRADQVEKAQATIALFTKDGDQGSNLFDMQCMWYELEIANAYRRLARTDAAHYGRALKNFVAVDKHFTDIVEDQFDFHTYCIRKMTLRAYVHMLRMEDTVHSHQFYVRAAQGAIETYIALVDKPKQDAAAAAADEEGEMTAAERKKAESKRKKAEAKAKAEAEAAKKDAAATAKTEAGGKPKKGQAKEKPADEDPDGAALAAAEDPLERASSFLRVLQQHAAKDLKTHTLACALALRKKRYLLALRALRRAVALAPLDDEVHTLTLEFLLEVQREGGSLSPTIAKVIEAQRAAINAPPGESLDALNRAYLRRAGGAPAAVLATAALQLTIAPDTAEAAKALVTALDPAALSLSLAVRTHKLLNATFRDPKAADAFRAQAVKRFPLADYFRPAAVAAAS